MAVGTYRVKLFLFSSVKKTHKEDEEERKELKSEQK